jgi:D-3-phosphoglycerate dehydrogenase / 2-oxoglutarate reductase
MKARTTVFIAQPTMYPEALRILEAGGRVMWGLPEDRRVSTSDPAAAAADLLAIRESLLEALPDIDGVFGHYPYDAVLIGASTRLRVIMTPSSGAEHVDITAATARGVAVVNAAGANYVPVAEHVFGLTLSLLRLIALADREAHRDRRQSTYARFVEQHRLPLVLNGKTLGVIGFGFIGREVARIGSQGFRMKVLAADPYFDPVEARRQGVTLVPDLAKLLPESDVVCVCCPLTAETRNLIGSRELNLMKPTAILVNGSRGGTVVTDDLVAALKSATIAGAALDVTEPEPLSPGHDLFALDNVVLTPHIAGASAQTLVEQSIQSARDGMMVLQGKKPFHLVNPEVWPRLRAST